MTTKIKEIKDSYFVTYGIFYSMGVLTLVPHQFFVISTDYWMYKFRDVYERPRPPHLVHQPGRWPNTGIALGRISNPYLHKEGGFANNRTPLQASFTSSFFIICHVSMLSFLIITALFSKKFPPPPKRIMGALFSMLVLFVINATFVHINTDSFQVEFFGITLVLAVLLNITSAITMISLFEMVTKFPLDYYAAILSGQALCGIISSSLQIITLSINCNSLKNAGIYFGFGSVLILSTSIFYLVTKRKSKYFIYRIGQYEGNDIVSDKWTVNFRKMRAALYRSKWILGSLVFVQGSTAMIHPGLAALVVSEDNDSGVGGNWNEVYFVPVITFFCFHLSDFVGRELARKVKQPRNPIAILILAILRLSLVPLLMLCNAQPRHHMPVYFGDKFYILLIILFGFTQGYLVNLCIISVPMIARKEELEFVTILIPLFSVITVTVCSGFNMMIIRLI